ncbi:alpha/beta fold hydrolase [Cellulomonas sp. PhB143]|uniref:alpha/beta fold hydrolase n=1 Tax=Cellulomonas sp. PhB143 TaxID=2485186 RepID=UPI000F46A573|nr:alpha/beta hydrolase [Cellulomonas sp. PhB143]ROS76807.1 pimeloyl-ACP methyl ester carboxylesterase [Cellulomonas sp. PhB143]
MGAEHGRVPVVLVHGARTSRTMWRAQVGALERSGRRALAVDLPGHGALRGESFTLAAAVAAVARAVDDVGGRALVVGLSLGGYVAIEHRAQRPEQSAGLVAASCCTDTASPLRRPWLRAARWIESWPDSGERLNRALVDATVPRAGRADLAEGGFALDAMSAVLAETGRCSPLDRLAQGRSPVWVVNGRLDHFRLQEGAFVRSARASGAPVRLVVLPGAKHLVSLDAPVAFSRVVLEAADSIEADARAARARSAGAQLPGARPADERGGVGDDDDVVPEPLERRGRDRP